MELVYVTFVKLSSQDTLNNHFNFPQKLISLKIYICDISVESVSTAEEFLFIDDELTTVTSFLLPECSVSSLKELGFFSHYGSDGGVNKFIELNPQLESLIIQSHSLNYITLNLIQSLTSLKSLELQGSLSLNSEVQIPTLESINKLNFDDVNRDNIEKVKKLSLSCPNLTGLHLKMIAHKNFQNTIDSHIAQIINRSPKLKFFSLIIIGNIFENIVFPKFHYLEALAVESGQLTILNIDFGFCTRLRKVTFKSFRDINTNEFKNKFNSIDGWKFKYNSIIIKGYKIL
ncbi:hypothetical protein CONCODRAFT_73137 [Conidiobolus coronatus NRRL 28638]|uniref:RNI-like protein n=1 Tax=Conidiobolus coronatus (strain ATCC 28846 / CBS 209.66 / NRRL 28638) TaxID=796925 RepID=A0A137NWV6_CONC2|nr:hypothetical protein CONCODRAFT_73137 [Conidiobolus coronatus NRRL 28638]|eukprot:KXN67236.1 hypothetical protein CONCODRAFT_73137 [Conidiobolus coronatus NRRL 28638]